MKPQAFEYALPSSVDEAVALLVEHGDEAKVLAGGQSLLPMMNFRLARPSALVDLGSIASLRGVDATPDGVVVGSMTTHRALEVNALPGPLGRLLRASARYIGHYPIRTRGTFGGSLAHCDPASEWCQLALLLDARMAIAGPLGSRTVGASDFLITVFTTALEYDEVLTAVTLPSLDAGTHVNVVEFARRAGDFAIASVMCTYTTKDGVISEARLCAGGVADRVTRLAAAEDLLVGQEPSEAAFRAAAAAAAAEIDPPSDLHGSSDYRRDLTQALVRRCLEGARP